MVLKRLDITNARLIDLEFLLDRIKNYRFVKIKNKYFLEYKVYRYNIEVLNADFDYSLVIDYPKKLIVESPTKLSDEELKENIMVLLEENAEYDYNDYKEIMCTDVEYRKLKVKKW